MKKSVFIFCVMFAILMLAVSVGAAPEDDPVQRNALMALYNSTNGAGWTNSSRWGDVSSYCTWDGVWCDGSTNVIYLFLSGNNLSGSIPSQLENLTNLEWLYLHLNNLNGPIPPELGNLGSLTNLRLNDNDLNGPIPKELTNLTNLQLLSLTGNPSLVCWETTAARDWAVGLSNYAGPTAVCLFDWLPAVFYSN